MEYSNKMKYRIAIEYSIVQLLSRETCMITLTFLFVLITHCDDIFGPTKTFQHKSLLDPHHSDKTR